MPGRFAVIAGVFAGALAASSPARAWEAFSCATSPGQRVKFPGDNPWPVRFRSNMPVGDLGRTVSLRAFAAWNAVPAARDVLSAETTSAGAGCVAPSNAGYGVAGWDDGTCYQWGSGVAGVALYTYSSCVIQNATVYLNSQRTLSEDTWTQVAIHEFGHYLHYAHNWFQVSILGYQSGGVPLTFLPAEDHAYLRGVFPGSGVSPPNLQLHRYVSLDPVRPDQASYQEAAAPTCSGGCSAIRGGDRISVKLTYGNTGAQGTASRIDIVMKLGSSEIGRWVLNGLAREAQNSAEFTATVPGGIAPGNYSLEVTIDPEGRVPGDASPSGGRSVQFPGFRVLVPTSWTCAASQWNANDGCHCGCGASDPDCDRAGALHGCPDPGTCRRSICSAAGTCAVENASGACDDGRYCTVNDVCVDGTCVGLPRSCAALDRACRAGACSESERACVAIERPDGEACSSYCVQSGQCSSGACVGAKRSCRELDDGCNAGVCDDVAGACVRVPVEDGVPCDDGLYCTVEDACASGRCAGAPRDCSHLLGLCRSARCDEASAACAAVPFPDGTECDDGRWCTEGEACSGGDCVGAERDCSEHDRACRRGRCSDEEEACVVAVLADGEACDDGSGCTQGDACFSGECSGTPLDCSGLTTECQVGTCNAELGRCVARRRTVPQCSAREDEPPGDPPAPVAAAGCPACGGGSASMLLFLPALLPRVRVRRRL